MKPETLKHVQHVFSKNNFPSKTPKKSLRKQDKFVGNCYAYALNLKIKDPLEKEIRFFVGCFSNFA